MAWLGFWLGLAQLALLGLAWLSWVIGWACSTMITTVIPADSKELPIGSFLKLIQLVWLVDFIG